MAGLPVVFLLRAGMYDLFYKLQRDYYDDLDSSEEVIEEDEDMLEVTTYTVEIVLNFTWLSLRQPSGPCHPRRILSNR